MMKNVRFGLLTILLLATLPLLGSGRRLGAQPPAAGRPPAASGASANPAAPNASKQGEEGFIDTVMVNVVNVDVFVKDKKTGARVGGLTKNDFEVLEDDRPMQVTNFYSVEGSNRMAAPAPAPPVPAVAPAPPPAPAAHPAGPQTDRLPLPEDQKLHLVIYIDNFSLKPFDRNRVMREIRIFLNEKLRRDDEVMLVTYDHSLKVRHPFTSDSSLVGAAMTALEKVSGEGVHAETERRDVLRNIDNSQDVGEAAQFATSYAGSLFNDLEFSIDGIKEVVTSLAGMPGRKAILYVSNGLPMVAAQDIFFAIQQKYPQQTTGMTEQMQYDASRRFEELAALANANRVTFYTIDAAGLRTYSSISAETQGASTPGLGVMVDQMDIQNLQSPLMFLAEKTGGIAVLNANRVGPHLDRIAEDFSSFYSLGYAPTHYGDGRYHKITVKVKRKGVEVRYREGYRDKSTESRMSDATLAVLSYPFELNPIGLTLEFGQAVKRSDGYFVVEVRVRIPVGKLTLVPRASSHEARVRLFIAAMDSDGGTSEVQQAQVPISVPLAEMSKVGSKTFIYTIPLLMRGGLQRVAIGLRDDLGAQESFVTGGVRIGA